MVLKGDIDVQFLGDSQELGTQRGWVHRLPSYRELNAALALICRQTFRNAPRQAVDLIDIQAVTSCDLANPSDMLGGDAPRQQSNDVTRFALTADPLAVFLGTDWRELYLLIQFIALEQDVLQHVRLAGHLYQNSKRQCVVDYRLPDVENIDLGLCQRSRNGSRQTRAVRASNVDQHDFLQGDALQEIRSGGRSRPRSGAALPGQNFHGYPMHAAPGFKAAYCTRKPHSCRGGRSSTTFPSGSSR